MKCKNCGAEFEEGMFCPECGTKLEEGENGTVENSVSEQPVAEAQKNVVMPKVEPRVEQKPVQERPEKNFLDRMYFLSVKQQISYFLPCMEQMERTEKYSLSLN